MNGFRILFVVAMFLACRPACAVEVEICNESRMFLEVTDEGEVLADAATGECFILQIGDKERWLINFGMTRYVYEFLFLRNCRQDDKTRLIATDDGKLYCGSRDQEQPKGFPMHVISKIDLI